MEGVLPLWHDLTFAGRCDWAPIHADESPRAVDLELANPLIRLVR